MQHHGAPTRLLDWTESFFWALFFALQRAQRCSDAAQGGCAADTAADRPAAVWVLDPEQWNAPAFGGDPGLLHLPKGFEPARYPIDQYHPNATRAKDQTADRVLAVVAPITNRRMQAQQGRFTLMADRFDPMESLEVEGGVLFKVEIPTCVRADAQALLAMAGQRYLSAFPDLDGLVRDIEEEHAFTLEELSRLDQPAEDRAE